MKLVEVPIPTAKKDEILLRVEAASINPFDWKVQKGMLRPFMPPKFPYIPAIDVAGEVIGVGPGVTSFKEGDKVVSILNVTKGGGLAEFTAASTALTVIRPPAISPSEGAGVPTAALTAVLALKAAGATFDNMQNSASEKQQKNILITAASGGVGLYALQLSKLLDYHITVTCGARNIDLLHSLGAHEVLDYRTSEGASLKSPSGKRYDAVIHCASSVEWRVLESNLSEDGVVVDVNPTFRSMALSVWKKVVFSRKRLVVFMLMPKVEELRFLMELMEQGKLKTIIDSGFKLENAKEAWAKSMEGHATGKIIIHM